MPELFDSVRTLQQDVMRNIVKKYLDVFSDLSDHEKNAEDIANRAIARVINQSSDENWEFHYTTAIGYPFEQDHFMSSRYSDGTFPIWHGSLEKQTTIYETAHNMIKTETALENFQQQETIVRERMVYAVFCNGILIDLTKKMTHYPELISEDYSFTQKIGKQLNQQGYPGLLALSARQKNGVNVNIFKSEILTHTRTRFQLTYFLFSKLKKVEVPENNKIINEITW